MKHEKISIKWKIFLYLLSFIGILLVVLWLLQTVYLDVFYKRIKKRELESAKNNLISVINDDDLDTAIDTIAKRYDISIFISDSLGNELFSSQSGPNSSIWKMRKDLIVKLYNQAKDNGGSLVINESDINEEQLKFQKNMDEKPGFDGNDQNDVVDSNIQQDSKNKFTKLPNMPMERDTESLIQINIVSAKNNSEYVIFLNSVITPVSATVHTIRIQLIYISFILIILSLGLAFIISKRVSHSIIKINDSAKELAKGDFSVEFTGKDYKEIAELSNTLNDTAKQLQKSDVLQKELLANVSHDLRTPLTMIAAYSEVMRDIPGENTPENVQVIIDESKRLTNLVNDLLDMSKIQAGVTELETKEYDLTESIHAIIERHSKLLDPYGYKIYFEYDKHAIVCADEFKIYQVIYNLIANAVNYTGEDKKVTIKQTVKDNYVRIEVIDTGAGISKEELKNVWDRYYKIDKSHKRAVMGTGLGLSIVNNILKLHHSKYGVLSEVGKGSTFWFELKCVDIIQKIEGSD